MKDVSDYVTAQKQLLQAERDHERNELSKSMHGTKLNSLEASGVSFLIAHPQKPAFTLVQKQCHLSDNPIFSS